MNIWIIFAGQEKTPVFFRALAGMISLFQACSTSGSISGAGPALIRCWGSGVQEEGSPEIFIIKKPDIDGFEFGCVFGSGTDLKFKDIAMGGKNLGIILIG